MPLYEYRCTSCGETTEVIQKVNDQPLQVCPACGGELTKVLSAPALQFKGSGWYLTDYGRKSHVGPGERSAEGGKADSAGSKTGDDSAKKGPDKPAADTKTSAETKSSDAKSNGK